MTTRLAVIEGNDLDERVKTFVFMGEGVTLGQALATIIQNFSDVVNCSYSITHPNEDKVLFHIQAREGRAVDILRRGLENLDEVCGHTIETFEKAMKTYKKEDNIN